jgi:GWxTD domain-containing protein
MKDIVTIRGVAAVALPLFICILIFWCAVLSAQTWVEYGDIPNPSRGDIVFYADVVTFYQGKGVNIEEVYCIVPNDQIEFIEEGEAYKGNLRFRTEISDMDGNIVGSTESSVEVSAASEDDASARKFVQVLQSEISIAPGRYTARVVIEDINALKRTILAYLKREHKMGEVKILIESKEFEEGELSISDIEFARGLRRVSEGPFHKSGFEVIPNAHRRYGLLLPELAIFFEVYDLREVLGERATGTLDEGVRRGEETGLDHEQDASSGLVVAYSVINKRGAEIFKNETPLESRGSGFANTALFDVTSLSAGTYLLSLNIRDARGDVLAKSDRKFDVVWSAFSWGRYEYETIGDMEYILTESEMSGFKELSPGGKEEFLSEFWSKIDPTPGTVQNEALEEHYRRVRYADRHFAGTGRGALTDRGRIYIKYGPPDDIQSFYSDLEFVQGTRDFEGESPVPTDPFSRVGLKAGSDASGSWDRAGSGEEARVATSARMQFILVDEKGIGDYRLVYSTEKQEY